MMKFNALKPLRLVSVRGFKSAKGNNLTFVKLCDTSTYESEEFLLSGETVVDVEAGKDYMVQLIVDGKYTNALLMAK